MEYKYDKLNSNYLLSLLLLIFCVVAIVVIIIDCCCRCLVVVCIYSIFLFIATRQFNIITTTGDTKSPRQDSTSVYYQGFIYTFGGCFENEVGITLADDTWKYDIQNSRLVIY